MDAAVADPANLKVRAADINICDVTVLAEGCDRFAHNRGVAAAVAHCSPPVLCEGLWPLLPNLMSGAI
jgi:hypothetical protein